MFSKFENLLILIAIGCTVLVPAEATFDKLALLQQKLGGGHYGSSGYGGGYSSGGYSSGYGSGYGYGGSDGVKVVKVVVLPESHGYGSSSSYYGGSVGNGGAYSSRPLTFPTSTAVVSSVSKPWYSYPSVSYGHGSTYGSGYSSGYGNGYSSGYGPGYGSGYGSGSSNYYGGGYSKLPVSSGSYGSGFGSTYGSGYGSGGTTYTSGYGHSKLCGTWC